MNPGRTLAVLALVSCTTKGVVAPPSLGKVAGGGPVLEICIPADVRALPERRGRLVGTAGWAFGDVYEFTHERGSLITRDIGLVRSSIDAPMDATRPAQALAESLQVSLSRTGHFSRVHLADTCADQPETPTTGARLWVRLDYGYGSGLLVSKKWRYPIAAWGDQVWMDTTRENSSAPLVGYARASMAYCTAEGCLQTTEVGQHSVPSNEARPGEGTRSRLNILYGEALSRLAESIGRRVIVESTGGG